jgi:hypothetical protein
VLVPHDDTALDIEVSARERERCGVEPEGVVVLGDHRDRVLAVDRVQIRPRRRPAVGPVGIAPAVAAKPRPMPPRAADAIERLGERPARVEPHLALCDRPRREVDVRVGEAGQHAPAAEVDDLRGGERSLVHADAARDPVSGDRERACLRKRRVERPDDAVLQDHRARAY